MSYNATVYKVVIASPIDVEEERKIARKVIHKWDDLHSEEKEIVLLPIGWETHSSPEIGERPQAIINKQILKNADLLIGIFWTRLGTPTEKAGSGTVEEIEEHIKAGKPAMLYFSNTQIEPKKIDNEQFEKVKAFKQKYRDHSLYHEFSTTQEFENKLYDHLVLKINDSGYFERSGLSSEHDSTTANDNFDSEMPFRELLLMNILASKGEQTQVQIQPCFHERGLSVSEYGMAAKSLIEKGFIRQTYGKGISYKIFPRGHQWVIMHKDLLHQLDAEILNDTAKKLLLKAVQSDGAIMKVHDMNEWCIQVNGANIIPSQDPRTVAKWEAALEELEKNDFIKATDQKDEVFQVTNKGYRYADTLKSSESE